MTENDQWDLPLKNCSCRMVKTARQLLATPDVANESKVSKNW